MFWTLTFGFGVQHDRSFASLQRLYENMAEIKLIRSSFVLMKMVGSLSSG
jgi:hypothetical protein